MPGSSELERMLRGASLRVTRPRVAVLAAVHDHPHADTHSIIGAARERLGEVSQQAVYDVLQALTEAGLVRRIHPPGSVVQLTDDRWAVVESVNAARPLKPRVTVQQPGVPSEEAPMVDLAAEPSIGIRRSVQVAQLPRELQEQLMPRQRTTWFFEATDEAPADDPERVHAFAH